MAGGEGRQRGAYLLLGCQRLANGPGYRGIVFQVVGQGQRPIAIDRQDGDAWFIGVTEQGDLVERRILAQFRRQGAAQAVDGRVPAVHGQFVAPALIDGNGVTQRAQSVRQCQGDLATAQAQFGVAVLGYPAMHPGCAVGIEKTGTRLCPPASRRAGAYATRSESRGASGTAELSGDAMTSAAAAD